MWRKCLFGMFVAVLALPLVALQPASALTVSPYLLEYDVEPGDMIAGTIKLHNESETSETYYSTVEDFVAADETGTPSFVLNAARSMKAWVNFDQSVITLEAGETVNVIYNINVPKTASPGGYYSGLLFQTSAPSAAPEGGVGAMAAVGPIVLVTVAGDVVEKASVAEFSVTPDSTTSLPVNFTIRMKNDGTVHLKPVGVIRVTNMFGGTAGVVPVNAEGGNVLPSSTRAFEASWQKNALPEDASELVQEWSNFGFGPYTATLIMNYGDGNQVVTATTNFMVMPWLLVVLFLILVVILVLLVNQYNKWLIKTYGKKK